MGAQKRKFAACAGPSIARSGLHTVYKRLTVLLLRAPMCRASVGRRFHEDKAVRVLLILQQNADYQSPWPRRLGPVRDVTSCVGAWSNYYF